MTQTKEAKEKTMRAIALDRFGGPETLKVQTVPIPEVEADEILIHVESAGVGAWDPFEREGGFVEVLGREAASNPGLKTPDTEERAAVDVQP